MVWSGLGSERGLAPKPDSSSCSGVGEPIQPPEHLGDDPSDTGQDVSLTLGGTMAPTQLPPSHLAPACLLSQGASLARKRGIDLGSRSSVRRPREPKILPRDPLGGPWAGRGLLDLRPLTRSGGTMSKTHEGAGVLLALMKPKRLKVYARLGLISTKSPIVKDLIEIITHRPMYQNNMKMVLDRYTAIQEGFGVKPRHM